MKVVLSGNQGKVGIRPSFRKKQGFVAEEMENFILGTGIHFAIKKSSAALASFDPELPAVFKLVETDFTGT